jgi:nitrile hydratase
MNGVHDLGGMHGFGPVVREENEPVFHQAWEGRVFALNQAMAAWRKWNIDMSRFAKERMPPADYLRQTYYERWLWGLEKLLVEHGFVSPAELEQREDRPPAAGRLLPGALRAADVPRFVQNPRGARVDEPVPPKFKVGDPVVARNIHPLGHTRVPRYVRGRRGVIQRDHGVFIFPDTHALGLGRKPQHVYSVRFTARELWGPDASTEDSVSVDLWDDHLDAA